MFKSEGEMAIELSKYRVFEDEDGWVMKFDPLCEKGCHSPFICVDPGTGESVSMKGHWSRYATVKEIFPDLEAIRACVVNYLSGKADISDEVVEEIFAMDSDCFWIKGSGGEQTRGFNPNAELSSCADVGEFAIEKCGYIYLVTK